MELINGRTAEEIKNAVAHCADGCCSKCAYKEVYDCSLNMTRDALALIERLEAAVPVEHARWTEDGECTRCGCTAEYTEYVTERYDYDWDENLVPCGIEYHRTYHTTDYYPNCGARMDGEADE